MMPLYSDGDPPPQYCASAGQIPQFTIHFASLIEDHTSDNLTSSTSSGTKITHIATSLLPLRRSWRRWRIAAFIAICTLIVFFTMESAIALVVSGAKSYSHQIQANKSSEGESSNELAELRSKAPSNLDCSVKQSQRRSKHGMVTARSKTTSNKNLILQSALVDQKLNMINPQQVAKPPWSSNHRILLSSVCTNKDISIFQSPDGSSGIPRYAVQIMNNCMSDCPPSDIHVFCGWFASALLVNPNSFKRIAYNDCVVNGGKPLRHGETLRFTYANSFMYPLRFKSASFCK